MLNALFVAICFKQQGVQTKYSVDRSVGHRKSRLPGNSSRATYHQTLHLCTVIFTVACLKVDIILNLFVSPQGATLSMRPFFSYYMFFHILQQKASSFPMRWLHLSKNLWPVDCPSGLSMKSCLYRWTCSTSLPLKACWPEKCSTCSEYKVTNIQRFRGAQPHAATTFGVFVFEHRCRYINN